MSVAVARLHPNPENATIKELRVAIDAAPDKRSYIRLNAIRSLLMGISRATLCQQFCRTDGMARWWIELFNRGGIGRTHHFDPPKPQTQSQTGARARSAGLDAGKSRGCACSLISVKSGTQKSQARPNNIAFSFGLVLFAGRTEIV